MSSTAIILGVVLLAVVFSVLMVVAVFRKRRFFRSKEYRDNLEALHAFSRCIQEKLSSQEIIGDDAIVSIVANGNDSLNFFSKIPYRLDEDISEVVVSCGRACREHSTFIDDLYRIGVDNRSPRQDDSSAEIVRCPKCGKGRLVRRKGQLGAFSGCSNYPQCDYMVNFLVSTNTPKCPACGGFLTKRYMKKTKVPFWGCTNYPYCSYTAAVPAKGMV